MMNEKTLKALIEAGAIKKVFIIASGATVHAEIITLNGSVIASTSAGHIKTWRSLDAACKWIRKLGIGRVIVDMAKWMPDQKGLGI